MHVVICYDIPLDKRRTKLFKGLKGFIQPVQKSVFEGYLPRRRYGALTELIRQTVDHEEDTVRIYHITRGAEGLTELIGRSEAVTTGEEDSIL